MKKFGLVIAALGALVIAAPSIASARPSLSSGAAAITAIIIVAIGARAEYRGHRDRGYHRGWHGHRDRVVVIKRHRY